MKILMRSVDMICCTNRDGVITPIKFRIADENKENRIIRIDRILSRKEEKLAGKPHAHFYRSKCDRWDRIPF